MPGLAQYDTGLAQQPGGLPMSLSIEVPYVPDNPQNLQAWLRNKTLWVTHISQLMRTQGDYMSYWLLACTEKGFVVHTMDHAPLGIQTLHTHYWVLGHSCLSESITAEAGITDVYRKKLFSTLKRWKMQMTQDMQFYWWPPAFKVYLSLGYSCLIQTVCFLPLIEQTSRTSTLLS